jgi:hypothetical protein
MLIDKQTILAAGDIITLKLLSSEEIVGRLVDQQHDYITISKPVLVALQPVSAKQMGLSFLPVLGSVEPETTLQVPVNALALRPVKTGPSVTSSYIQMTSGLITPSGNGLI